MTDKTLKDLEGWTSIGSMPGLMRGSNYTILKSPDGKRIAQVHLNDGEVSIIFNREEKKVEYIHSATVLGMKRVGVTKEMMERMLGRAYEKEEAKGE